MTAAEHEAQRTLVVASLAEDERRAGHSSEVYDPPLFRRVCDHCGFETVGRASYWRHRLVECPGRSGA